MGVCGFPHRVLFNHPKGLDGRDLLCLLTAPSGSKHFPPRPWVADPRGAACGHRTPQWGDVCGFASRALARQAAVTPPGDLTVVAAHRSERRGAPGPRGPAFLPRKAPGSGLQSPRAAGFGLQGALSSKGVWLVVFASLEYSQFYPRKTMKLSR